MSQMLRVPRDFGRQARAGMLSLQSIIILFEGLKMHAPPSRDDMCSPMWSQGVAP